MKVPHLLCSSLHLPRSFGILMLHILYGGSRLGAEIDANGFLVKELVRNSLQGTVLCTAQ